MNTRKFFHRSQQVLGPLSAGTLAVLIALVPLRLTLGLELPAWVAKCAFPVLAAGAIGYITNWIAIEMLFKPYSPDEKHWFRWLSFGLWKQGLVSANKADIGRVLGEEIPAHLLDPDKISTSLCTLAEDILQNRELIDNARVQVDRFLRLHGDAIATFLLPYVKDSIAVAVRENITPGNLREFWDAVVRQWLAKDENRDYLAAAIVGEFQQRCPDLAGILKSNAAPMAKKYVSTKHPTLSKYLRVDDFIAGLVAYFDWEHIESQIHDMLAEPETVHMISNELSSLSDRVSQWLRTPEAEIELDSFLENGRQKLETILHDYIAEKLPVLAANLFDSELTWSRVEQHVLPKIRNFVTGYLSKHGKDEIVAKLDLSRRIEESVAKQDIRQFHGMIKTAVDDHLGAIQVLGYFIGMGAGLFMGLANL